MYWNFLALYLNIPKLRASPDPSKCKEQFRGLKIFELKYKAKNVRYICGTIQKMYSTLLGFVMDIYGLIWIVTICHGLSWPV